MTWVLGSTRIKQTFLRPTSDYGASAPHLATGFRRFCVTAVWGFLFLFAASSYASFVPPPKEAVKALKITKGRPFSCGVVFVDGKFIEPPYVVERYGNVLRINKIQISNAIVDWSDFFKTQDNLVVTKLETSAPASVDDGSAHAPASNALLDSADDDDPLSDLFDDTPAKHQDGRQNQVSHHTSTPKATARKTKTKISLNGEFKKNAKSSMYVNKINALRAEIDASLRRGCFFCFGSSYSRVSGDREAAHKILREIPKLMKDNSEFSSFAAAVRKSGFVYFPPKLVHEMFANRLDYLSLQKRWKAVLEELEFDSMLDRAGASRY